jgi:hypothetical protein
MHVDLPLLVGKDRQHLSLTTTLYWKNPGTETAFGKYFYQIRKQTFNRLFGTDKTKPKIAAALAKKRYFFRGCEKKPGCC